MTEHWFWWTLTITCIVWYSTVTIYIAIKGTKDVKGMLKRLEKMNEQSKHPD